MYKVVYTGPWEPRDMEDMKSVHLHPKKEKYAAIYVVSSDTNIILYSFFIGSVFSVGDVLNMSPKYISANNPIIIEYTAGDFFSKFPDVIMG